MGNSSYTTKKINYAEGLAVRPNLLTNSSAAENVNGWNTYADAAGVLPVDMTGGSATQLTFSRTTTGGEVLNGDASFKIVKAAANAQGQGVSTDFTVPAGYAGQQMMISFPFKIISGSLVQGDLQVYVYDVTNSTIITPVNLDIVGSQGMLLALFSVPTSCTSARVGLHFASTSTTAVTIVFDDVQVAITQGTLGGQVLSKISFSGFTGFASTNTATFRATTLDTFSGDGFTYTNNSTEGTYITILKPGLVTVNCSIQNGVDNGNTLIAILKNPSSGQLTSSFNTSPASDSVVSVGMVRSNAELVVASGSFQAVAGDKIYLTGITPFSNYQTDSNSGKFRVTHVASDVTLTSSSTYRMSSILANGTRVTGSAPTALGQYRSYLRNGSARTFTETNGTPTILPTNSDGIALYQGGGYGTADSSGQPSKYDIFVGKNKSVRLEFYKSAGKTGFVSTDVHANTSQSELYGYFNYYDPSTGILSIVPYMTSTASFHWIGSDELGNDVAQTNCYFDVIVSENALAVGVQAPRSVIRLQGINVYGSSGTKIPRFTNTLQNLGNAITYTDSATNGASFTINETGIYSIMYSNGDTATSYNIGLSLNSSQLSTAITTINTADLLAITGRNGGYVGIASVTMLFNAGDIIRPHDEAQLNGTIYSSSVRFYITKVSN